MWQTLHRMRYAQRSSRVSARTDRSCRPQDSGGRRSQKNTTAAPAQQTDHQPGRSNGTLKTAPFTAQQRPLAPLPWRYTSRSPQLLDLLMHAVAAQCHRPGQVAEPSDRLAGAARQWRDGSVLSTTASWGYPAAASPRARPHHPARAQSESTPENTRHHDIAQGVVTPFYLALTILQRGLQ